VIVCIKAVIGDTYLSSAAWTFGSKLSGMALYDSCIVVLNVQGTTVSIPSARVLTDIRPQPKDTESALEPMFPNRGGSNLGRSRITWWYWIPCSDGKWLQLHTDNMHILGERSAAVVSDEQVTAKLVSGELFVGIRHVNDVREIVEKSNAACHILQKMFY